MAIKYNTPTSALPTDWDYSSDSKYHEYWVDFKEKALQGEWAGALNSKFNDNFGEATKDWTVEDYRNWAKASGFTESIKKGLPSDYQQWTNILASDDVGGIQRVIGALVMDRYGKFTAAKWEASSSDIAAVADGMRSYGAQKDLVTNLREKGGTDEQIQAVLDQQDGTTDGYSSLLNDIKDLSGDAWNRYIDESFVNILPDNTWGESTVITVDTASDNGFTETEDGTYISEDGTIFKVNTDNELVSSEDGTPATTGGYTPSDATIAVATADTPQQSAQNAATSTVLGDSSLEALRNYASENDLTLVEDPDNNSYVLNDADGNEVNKFAVDNDNNQLVYVGGEKDGQRFSVGGMPERADAMQDVEDTYFQEQQGLVGELGGLRNEYGDYMTSVVGGDINEGVAKQLGWTKTDTGWTDPNGNPYTVNEETGLLESDGVAATTKGTFEENDFAGQINAQLNQFLTGKDADGKAILDGDGNPIKGFLDYQSDLEDAAGTYKTDMKDLAGYRDPESGEWVDGLYDTAYKNYADDLEPLRGKLSGITDAALQVAGDANSTNYYNRLSDLYYQDAKDEIDRNAAGVQDTLMQQYASSGLDPSSPAFTAAMTDLAKSRSDSLRSSRRLAILDSYGLGSKMLSNRTSALNSASSAIGTEMGALDSLYGVKLEGLNTRRDMIGQIYGADKDVAATGISGLNTVLNTNLQGINADQTQFNTKLGLNKDFYNTQFQNLGLQFDALGNVRSTANQEGKDATDSILDFNQDLNSDKFNYITLENMFKDRDEDVPTWLQDELSKYGIK